MSVIVAARDAGETLEETLASIRAQTFADWEVVLVDDGSTDDTGEIARAAIDRIRVLRHEVAQGPGASRNRAVREARGELVAILDADDVWRPRYLESQLAVYDQALAEGRHVGAVCCDADLLGPDGPTGARWSQRVGGAQAVDLTTMLHENVVFTSVLCPRSAFLNLGGYEETNRTPMEDYDLWLRMLEAGWDIVVNPETLAVYRLTDVSRSANVERMAIGGSLLMTWALERGALTPAQRRLARKRRRMYEVVRRRAKIAVEPGLVRRAVAMVRAAPAIALSVLEHPERWGHWLRDGPRSAGQRRHAG